MSCIRIDIDKQRASLPDSDSRDNATVFRRPIFFLFSCLFLFFTCKCSSFFYIVSHHPIWCFCAAVGCRMFTIRRPLTTPTDVCSDERVCDGVAFRVFFYKFHFCFSCLQLIFAVLLRRKEEMSLGAGADVMCGH